MLHGTSCTLKKLKNPMVTYENIEIELVDSYKYLGIVIDLTLTFSQYGNNIKGKAIG